MTSLLLTEVSKSFGGLAAVSDVTMEVPVGQVTGLIGPNGAGKTTVVNLITGTLALSSGSIRLGEQEIGEKSPIEVARLGLSRTFQNIRLMQEATVLENVMIGFHRHEEASLLNSILGLGASRREGRLYRDRTFELLERFDMTRYADAPAGSLAYGHQRRVEMMRAVASQPRILLLDEPVAGMNDTEAYALGEIFADLAANGLGLLLIEHNIRFVSRMCTNVHVLDSGKQIASGTPAEVMRDDRVVAAYLGGH